MRRPPTSDLTRYGYAVVLIALATAGRLALTPLIGGLFPFATLFLAVLIAAGYGGSGPGLLATALGALTSALFLLPSRHAFAVGGGENRARLILFVAAGLSITLLGGALRNARRRAEASAAEAIDQGERLRATLASIGDAVIATDEAGRVGLMNPVAERLTGWGQAEAAGRPIGEVFRIVDRETRRPVEDLTARVLREGVVGPSGRGALLGKAGVERLIEESVAPIRAGGGPARGAVLVFRDVTERERAEERTREAEERFRALADNIPQLAWMARPDGSIFWYNRRWYEYTGTTFEQMEGGGWQAVHDPAGLPSVRAKFEAHLASGEPWEDTFPLRRHDGEYRWHLSRALPLRDERGRIVRWFGTNTDITERRRIEEALRLAQRQLEERANVVETLLRASPMPIFVSYDRECREIAGNPAGYELLKTPIGGVVSATAPDDLARTRPYREYRDGRPVAPHDLPMQVAAREGVEVKGAELTYVFDDGDVKQIYGNAVPLRDEAGRVTGAVAGFVDVTKLKEAERALKEADRRKDEFLATLAHELRNPLAPIRSAVEVLRIGAPTDPDLIWCRDVIDRQVGQMARLLDDLLDVSRITRGKLDLRRARIALGDVLEAAVETSRPVIDAGGHELVVDVPAEPVYLDADPVRLAQVFANLLNNAAKYTERGGWIRLAAEPAGREVVVSVKDDGIGIAPEVLPRLFEIFSQATPALERSQGGLGIGLALVKGLVERHGGTVAARSDGLGRGSEFLVRLPVAPGPPEPARPPAEVGGAVPSGRRIVVADDNRDAADGLARMLRLDGHEVRTAYDGEQAVEEAGAFRPDVVLLDIGMPRLNGYEAARRIRGQPWGREMILVALTGWGQEEDRRRSAEAGFDDHLVKPVDPSTLEGRLGALTRGRE